MRDYEFEYNEAKSLAEEYLDSYFNGPNLDKAMRYSVMAGGKRIRPILTLKFCEAAGGGMSEAIDFACAVEMLHTYSLIHDDLPCMDNDDLRRGIPTNHKVYGECTAVLAGDALQAAAFETALAVGTQFEPDRLWYAVEAARTLAEAAGSFGMCGGQYCDTVENGVVHTAEELTEINDMKTGALLRAACVMGVLASAGHRDVDKVLIKAAKEYATKLGLAFQIRDDILDSISTTEELGKPVGSDEENGKSTYVTLLGVEECEKLVRQYTDEAKKALSACDFPGGTSFLEQLADELAERKY